MARKKKEVKVPHTHVWDISIDFEPSFCECEGECNCQDTPYVVAKCKCGKRLDAADIEVILNIDEVMKSIMRPRYEEER